MGSVKELADSGPVCLFHLKGGSPQVVVAEIRKFAELEFPADVMFSFNGPFFPIPQEGLEGFGGKGLAPIKVVDIQAGGNADEIAKPRAFKFECFLLGLEGDHGLVDFISWIAMKKYFLWSLELRFR